MTNESILELERLAELDGIEHYSENNYAVVNNTSNKYLLNKERYKKMTQLEIDQEHMINNLREDKKYLEKEYVILEKKYIISVIANVVCLVVAVLIL